MCVTIMNFQDLGDWGKALCENLESEWCMTEKSQKMVIANSLYLACYSLFLVLEFMKIERDFESRLYIARVLKLETLPPTKGN